jgi:hypothetical protein
MKYVEITWWPNSYHVYKEGERVGIVNGRKIDTNGREREVWYAHNKHFFHVGGEFPTRAKAASILNTKPIKHDSSAFK